MSSIANETGIVLGFGGSNARVGTAELSDITKFESVPTPDQPKEFFGWMARQTLNAADQGAQWLVAGFPGLVTPDGKLVGPMVNVSGLAKKQYDLPKELNAADPAIGRLLETGFPLIAVNDGELAAQAAAAKVGDANTNRAAAIILGTGVGTGIVERDPTHDVVYRADRSPNEIGHLILSNDPKHTIENTVSGTALEHTYKERPEDLPADHPAWEKVGGEVGRMTMLLGLMNGVDLVVPCGGVGGGASNKYTPHLRAFMEACRKYGNEAQIQCAPKIIPVSPSNAQIFELFGGQGVIRDFATRIATTEQVAA